MKQWWQSKTVWVNVLTLVASGLTMLAGSDSIDPQVVAVLTGVAIPIVNVLLRFITDKAIVFK